MFLKFGSFANESCVGEMTCCIEHSKVSNVWQLCTIWCFWENCTRAFQGTNVRRDVAWHAWETHVVVGKAMPTFAFVNARQVHCRISVWGLLLDWLNFSFFLFVYWNFCSFVFVFCSTQKRKNQQHTIWYSKQKKGNVSFSKAK